MSVELRLYSGVLHMRCSTAEHMYMKVQEINLWEVRADEIYDNG